MNNDNSTATVDQSQDTVSLLHEADPKKGGGYKRMKPTAGSKTQRRKKNKPGHMLGKRSH